MLSGCGGLRCRSEQASDAVKITHEPAGAGNTHVLVSVGPSMFFNEAEKKHISGVIIPDASHPNTTRLSPRRVIKPRSCQKGPEGRSSAPRIRLLITRQRQ